MFEDEEESRVSNFDLKLMDIGFIMLRKFDNRLSGLPGRNVQNMKLFSFDTNVPKQTTFGAD